VVRYIACSCAIASGTVVMRVAAVPSMTEIAYRQFVRHSPVQIMNPLPSVKEISKSAIVFVTPSPVTDSNHQDMLVNRFQVLPTRLVKEQPGHHLPPVWQRDT
jgi:hypothetical protein